MTNSKLSIIWQDDHLLVLDKPPFISVNPSETEKEDTLVDLVVRELGIPLERAGIIHRLDKNTSGVILVAKNQETLEGMQAQFKAREVHKEYVALVHGNVEEETGSIDAPIDRNPVNRVRFTVIGGGRDSVTDFRVEKRFELPMEQVEELVGSMKKKERVFFENEATRYSFLRLFPKTGRTHQIRVHLKFINHPIVGDEVYVGRKLGRFDHRWCKRQFLHASKISFRHPATGKEVSFESELAGDLQESLAVFLFNVVD